MREVNITRAELTMSCLRVRLSERSVTISGLIDQIFSAGLCDHIAKLSESEQVEFVRHRLGALSVKLRRIDEDLLVEAEFSVPMTQLWNEAERYRRLQELANVTSRAFWFQPTWGLEPEFLPAGQLPGRPLFGIYQKSPSGRISVWRVEASANSTRVSLCPLPSVRLAEDDARFFRTAGEWLECLRPTPHNRVHPTIARHPEVAAILRRVNF